MSKKHAFYISGDDIYERKEKIEEIVSSILTPEEQSHALTRLSASEVTEATIAHMKVLPFLSERQVFIIRNCEKLKKKACESLISFLEHPAPSTYLIFEGSELGDANGERKQLKKLCTVHELKPQGGDYIRNKIQATLKKEGRLLSPDALDLLEERVGRSSAFLNEALSRILLLTQQGDMITEDMILDNITSFVSFDVYDLTNALSAKDLQKSLETFTYLIEKGSLPVELMGMIGWLVRRLLEAKLLLEKGVGREDIQRQLRINRYYVDRFLGQVKAFTKKELIAIIDELFQIDNRIKQGRGEAAQELELLFIRLCRNQFV